MTDANTDTNNRPDPVVDKIYAGKIFAAHAGHYLTGDPPPCRCGAEFKSWADADAHLLSHAEAR